MVIDGAETPIFFEIWDFPGKQLITQYKAIYLSIVIILRNVNMSELIHPPEISSTLEVPADALRNFWQAVKMLR